MFFHVGILERLVITTIKRVVNCLLACTAFSKFNDKEQIYNESEILTDGSPCWLS